MTRSAKESISKALVRTLDGPYHDLKERWRDEVSAEDVIRDPAQNTTEARAWVLEKLIGLSKREFITAGFPAEYGGTGDQAESVAHFEMMAFGDLSLTIKSGVQEGLFGGAITNLGTEWHHKTFLPQAISVELPGCFGMTELTHGSDVQNIETTITYLPKSDEFEVHSETPGATKVYIGNAATHGRMAVVFGQLQVAGEGHGVHAILVPIRDEQGKTLPGITIGDHGHKGGLLGVDNGTLRFDHIRVPRRMLLDRYGGVDEAGNYHSPIESKNARFFTMIGTLVRGRICIGGGAASTTRKAITIATRYACSRTQFRRPGSKQEIALLDYQTHQRKILPNIARAYAYGFAQNELSQELQRVWDLEGSDPKAARRLETQAAAMKSLQSNWANDTLQVMREACGGAGYISESGITLARQDADVFATFEGDNTVLQQLVAKGLLLEYKEAWSDLDKKGTAQATAKLIGRAVMERTTARAVVDRLVSIAKAKPESEQLLARGWHIQMFDYREQHTLESLAQRLRGASKADDKFAAVNQAQEHMLAAARAYTDRMVLDAFVAAIEHSEAAVTPYLVQLCDLYALATIEQNRAWFLEHEAFDSQRSKAVTAAVDDLCAQLRPQALELVAGLGVPEGWLNSTLV